MLRLKIDGHSSWFNINLMLTLRYITFRLKITTLISMLLFASFGFCQLPDSIFISSFEKEAFENFTNDSSLKSQLSLFMTTSEGMNWSNFEAQYEELLTFNQENQLGQSPKKLFHTVQDSFLGVYQEAALMNELFDDSIFSCVTGSALIAFYLQLNGFEYKIEEMPEHVFLTTEFKNRTYLLESTDPQFGFLKDNKLNRNDYEPDSLDNNHIFKLISSYSHLGKGGILVKSEITLYELAGLNHYNEAVKAVNVDDYVSAARNLEKALYLYPSKRIAEMYKYCLIQLVDNKTIEFDRRSLYLNRLYSLSYPLSMN